MFHSSPLLPAGRQELGVGCEVRGTGVPSPLPESPRPRPDRRGPRGGGGPAMRREDAPCGRTRPGRGRLSRSGRAFARTGRPRRTLPPSGWRPALGGWARAVSRGGDAEGESGSPRSRGRQGVEGVRAAVCRYGSSGRDIRGGCGRRGRCDSHGFDAPGTSRPNHLGATSANGGGWRESFRYEGDGRVPRTPGRRCSPTCGDLEGPFRGGCERTIGGGPI
jgi:hypothetical protein